MKFSLFYNKLIVMVTKHSTKDCWLKVKTFLLVFLTPIVSHAMIKRRDDMISITLL